MSRIYILNVTLVVVIWLSGNLQIIKADPGTYFAGISSVYNKTVCLQSVYGANITKVSLSWTLIRFQWFYETVRKFNPSIDLTRNYAVEGDNGDEDSNATLTLKLKLDESRFQIRLSLNVEDDEGAKPGDNVVKEEYECEFTITTRHGSRGQTALGRRRSREGGGGGETPPAVLFQWSFFDESRSKLGELMDIYTKVVVIDGRGYYKIRERESIILPAESSVNQSINFRFIVKKIEFNVDDQLSFT